MTARWRAEQEAIFAIQRIKMELAAKRAEATRCERAGDLARAADITYGQIGELDRRVDAAAKALGELQAGGGLVKAEVDTEEVAVVVSAWTGVPVAQLMEGEAAKLIQMEDVIRRRVVGQDEAVRAVSGPIRRSRAGLADGNRPIGTFLFLGPTGVGKTDLARALANAWTAGCPGPCHGTEFSLSRVLTSGTVPALASLTNIERARPAISSHGA